MPFLTLLPKFLLAQGTRHFGGIARDGLSPSSALADVGDEVFSLLSPLAFQSMYKIIGARRGKDNSIIDDGVLLL